MLWCIVYIISSLSLCTWFCIYFCRPYCFYIVHFRQFRCKRFYSFTLCISGSLDVSAFTLLHFIELYVCRKSERWLNSLIFVAVVLSLECMFWECYSVVVFMYNTCRLCNPPHTPPPSLYLRVMYSAVSSYFMTGYSVNTCRLGIVPPCTYH